MFVKEIILKENNTILFKCSLDKTTFPMHQNSRYNSTSETKHIIVLIHMLYYIIIFRTQRMQHTQESLQESIIAF